MSRISKYTAKMNPDSIKAAFAAQKDTMVTTETSVFAEQENLEAIAKGVLSDEASVHTLQLPWYLAYVKQLGRIQKKFHGGTFMMAEVMVCYNKWLARGLTSQVLVNLAYGCFDIVIPPTP